MVSIGGQYEHLNSEGGMSVSLPVGAALLVAAVWQHPAGLVDDRTILEVREKLETQEWARDVYREKKALVDKWVEVSSERLEEVFPTKRSNVYHNFSCPDDRSRLQFDPFENGDFVCPTCGRHYAPEFDAGIYAEGDKYHGTVYDGWACLFYQTAADVASDIGVFTRLEKDDRYAKRGIEILRLFARALRQTPTENLGKGQEARILRYNREGDSNLLGRLAVAHELLRDSMTQAEREEIERDVLRRMLDEGMIEPFYPYDHNNLYQWHRTIVQTAIALEDEAAIDWSYGYGKASPDLLPDHHSIRRMAEEYFLPDGAYWGLCSGYHLYPLHALCEFAVLSRNLSAMDPQRFPAAKYDFTCPDNPAGETIKRAIEWFLSMAMPDRTMPTVGDSMAPRAGLDDYYMTAEVGYRFFDVAAIGDYESLRQGDRVWPGLLYGSPEIRRQPTSFTSSFLFGGWVSLRNEWQGNRVWVGLNALKPGSGHQHADRLTLLHYSHGRLLSLEKATPYNEMTTRVLGKLSPSHNTVTVDRLSQTCGNELSGEQVPTVRYFFACPIAKFAEIRADKVYPQTTCYRRSVVLVEDVVVDLFDAQGGTTHDWIVNHAGGPPFVSLDLQPATFEPEEWLANGTGKVLRGEANSTWSSLWRVEDATSRLTVLGGAASKVYGLETYPVDSAVVTAEHPPCQTLCVRRNDQSPFLAVWDAWKETPNFAQGALSADNPKGVSIRTGTHTYHILFGTGEARWDDGVRLKSDSALLLLRDRNASVLIGGSTGQIETPEGNFDMISEIPLSVAADWSGEKLETFIAGDIQYDTYGGIDHPRPAPKVVPAITGSLLGN